ncbi:MAG: Druantia anti-phage system protein DruA [Syntrophobacteraceae bacterium]
MDTILNYRSRSITRQDISFIGDLIAANPDDNRTALSRKICRAWAWAQANGYPKEMICRGLLLQLERDGYIVLPPRQAVPRNPCSYRKRPAPVQVNQTLVQTDLKHVKSIILRQVRRTELEKLHDGLIDQFHYLGYAQPVGEHLKYLAFAHERPIACLTWCSVARHIGCRDRFIGWSAQERMSNLHLLAYNTRFLILPWVRVPHLASHLLAKCSRIISGDWQALYSHPVYWLETFVDTQRFKGTCYRAANWICLGETTGRGKQDHTRKPNRSIKTVWGYPLCRDFTLRFGHPRATGVSAVTSQHGS